MRGDRIQKTCERCGATMILIPSRRNQRFCSQGCANRHHAEAISEIMKRLWQDPEYVVAVS